MVRLINSSSSSIEIKNCKNCKWDNNPPPVLRNSQSAEQFRGSTPEMSYSNEPIVVHKVKKITKKKSSNKSQRKANLVLKTEYYPSNNNLTKNKSLIMDNMNNNNNNNSFNDNDNDIHYSEETPLSPCESISRKTFTPIIELYRAPNQKGKKKETLAYLPSDFNLEVPQPQKEPKKSESKFFVSRIPRLKSLQNRTASLASASMNSFSSNINNNNSFTNQSALLNSMSQIGVSTEENGNKSCYLKKKEIKDQKLPITLPSNSIIMEERQDKGDCESRKVKVGRSFIIENKNRFNVSKSKSDISLSGGGDSIKIKPSLKRESSLNLRRSKTQTKGFISENKLKIKSISTTFSARAPSKKMQPLNLQSSAFPNSRSCTNLNEKKISENTPKLHSHAMYSRYLSDLEWRICHAVNIYVFRNGVEAQLPTLIHIPPSAKKNMRSVLQIIQDRMKYPVGFAKTLYKMDGIKVKHPCELEMYNNYVIATNTDKCFKCVHYGRTRSPLMVLNKESKHVRVLRMKNEFYDEWLLKKKANYDERPQFIYPVYYTSEGLAPPELPIGQTGNYKPCDPRCKAGGCCSKKDGYSQGLKGCGGQEYIVNTCEIENDIKNPLELIRSKTAKINKSNENLQKESSPDSSSNKVATHSATKTLISISAAAAEENKKSDTKEKENSCKLVAEEKASSKKKFSKIVIDVDGELKTIYCRTPEGKKDSSKEKDCLGSVPSKRSKSNIEWTDLSHEGQRNFNNLNSPRPYHGVFEPHFGLQDCQMQQQARRDPRQNVYEDFLPSSPLMSEYGNQSSSCHPASYANPCDQNNNYSQSPLMMGGDGSNSFYYQHQPSQRFEHIETDYSNNNNNNRYERDYPVADIPSSIAKTNIFSEDLDTTPEYSNWENSTNIPKHPSTSTAAKASVSFNLIHQQQSRASYFQQQMDFNLQQQFYPAPVSERPPQPPPPAINTYRPNNSLYPLPTPPSSTAAAIPINQQRSENNFQSPAIPYRGPPILRQPQQQSTKNLNSGAALPPLYPTSARGTTRSINSIEPPLSAVFNMPESHMNPNMHFQNAGYNNQWQIYQQQHQQQQQQQQQYQLQQQQSLAYHNYNQSQAHRYPQQFLQQQNNGNFSVIRGGSATISTEVAEFQQKETFLDTKRLERKRRK